MKLLCTCVFTFLVKLTTAQFAIISDKDGYSNVRDSAGTGSKVVDKLNNGHFVYCFETKGNWIYINYTKNKQELTGYVYNDRLKKIDDYLSIPASAKGEHAVIFKKDPISITITQQPFDKRKYKVSYYKQEPSQIELLNGKPYWGRDGGLPTTSYKQITVQIGARTINLPRTAFDDLFEPSLYNSEVRYDQQHDILYIYSMNSDGAGAYYVIWRIIKGVYKDRYIEYGF